MITMSIILVCLKLSINKTILHSSSKYTDPYTKGQRTQQSCAPLACSYIVPELAVLPLIEPAAAAKAASPLW